MERAGRAVARAAARIAGRRYGARFLVVCGKGNNGGDGFVAARELAREGAGVTCAVVFDAGQAKGDAAHHLALMRRAGIEPRAFHPGLLENADVVIDAIFGTGFSGAARGPAASAIAAISKCPAPVVAVDIPSGVNGRTGAVEGPAVRAAATVALAAQKTGTAVGAGAALSGEVEVAGIGIPFEEPQSHLVERADVAAVLPRRPPEAHKRSAGAVALLGGSAGMSGAPVLAARGAMRAGAGYVTVGATADVDDKVSNLLPEVLSQTVVDEDVLGPKAIDAFAPVLHAATAVALGPGLGRGGEQRALVERALAEIPQPLVLDADGLNVLAPDPGPLQIRTHPAVITPHPAEMARLDRTDVGTVLGDRMGVASAASRRLGCVVLLKGFHTVVAAPDGRVVVNPIGGPELATAGTGDVLTGVVAAFCAAGLGPFEAAWAGAYVHGLAGGIAARAGSHGVLAWDVAEALQEAIAQVLDP
jgi:NAD(P)H-hydrate epimerase